MNGSKKYRFFVVSQVVVVTTTLILGALSYVVPHVTGHRRLYGLISFFDVGGESNFPAYLSTINLLVAAGLCYLIYKTTEVLGQKSRYWLILAGIFVFLSVDEGAQIHERFALLRGLFPETDLLSSRHDWLFVGVLVAGLLGVMMIPFLFQLPVRLAMWFAMAGSIFSLGALGGDFLGSIMLSHGFSVGDFAYQLRRLLEESLEMYGIVIFNCVAAGELSRRAVNFKLRVCEAGSSNSNN